MMRSLLSAAAVCAVAWGIAGAAPAAVPEQFQVWGKQHKRHPFLVDAGTIPVAAPLQVTAQEEHRGFIVVSKPSDFVAKSDFTPTAADRCAALAAGDCPGQYGAVTFRIVSLLANEYSVAVTDLAGPGGKAIGAEDFDVRAVFCIRTEAKGKEEVVPLLLEACGKVALSQKDSRQFRERWGRYQYFVCLA